VNDTPRPPDYPAWLAALGHLIFRLIGWRVEGQVPNVPKFVMIGAYHTSNFDGVLLVGTAWILRARLEWLGKQALFQPPLGGLMRAVGGIPVDRRGSTNAVDQVVQTFSEREKLALVIAPEGTRKRTGYWKTGFYYIALGANVPLVLGFLDYRRRVAGVGPVIYPSGDIQADMEQIKAFYATVTPRYPANKGEVILKPAEGDER
jgi:1-acyl-sn-glycerol-3-phosphate acyltransferase